MNHELEKNTTKKKVLTKVLKHMDSWTNTMITLILDMLAAVIQHQKTPLSAKHTCLSINSEIP